MLSLILALTLALAFANGANDVSKGIATLAGSGIANYRAIILWGTIWTVAGAMTAACSEPMSCRGGSVRTNARRGAAIADCASAATTTAASVMRMMLSRD